MTGLVRARVLKVTDADASTLARLDATVGGGQPPARPRRIAAEVLRAREEATRIVAEARAEAVRAVAGAVEDAAREARDAETAKLAASFLALRHREETHAANQQDELITLATALAERLLGETLRIEPVRIAELAVTAMQEARGARQVRIDAAPEDVAPLREALAALGQTAKVTEDAALTRGSLVVHTDIGKIDARIEPQLARLATALREALR